MNKNQSRQGDVFVEQINEYVPNKTGKTAKRIVLAHGEVTGHHHSAIGEFVGDVADSGELKYHQIIAQGYPINVADLVAFAKTQIKHQEHGPVPAKRGTIQVRRQREYSPEAIRNVAD